MTDLIPFWELFLLATIICIALSSGLAYLVAYEWLSAKAISRAFDTVFGWLWARRITQLSPIYGRPDPYRTMGPEARENLRGWR